MKTALSIRFCLFLTCLAGPLFLFAQHEKGEYTDGKQIRSRAAWQDPDQEKESVVEDYIHLYQKYLSGSRGSQCAMYPSCSNYGLKTFRERPFPEAILLTSERLMRCSHEHKYYDLTLQNGEARLLDYPIYAEAPDSLKFRPQRELFAYNDAKNVEDKALAFVKKLINENLYSEALLEINRLQFFEGRADKELYLNKLICYRSLNEGEKAVMEYETKFPPLLKTDPDVVLQVAQGCFELNNYQRGLRTLNLADTTTLTPPQVERIRRMQGLAQAHLGNWNEAAAALSFADGYRGDRRQTERNADQLRKAMQLKPKNSTVASLLSVVPGLGYLYTGHKQTAFTSFAINGLLAYATYTSLKTENYGVAAVMGVFTTSFYLGNIFGAGHSADRYNNNQRKKILQSLESNNLFNY